MGNVKRVYVEKKAPLLSRQKNYRRRLEIIWELRV